MEVTKEINDTKLRKSLVLKMHGGWGIIRDELWKLAPFSFSHIPYLPLSY